MMAYKYIRFYEQAMKRVGKDLYAGIGYHYEKYSSIEDKLLDLPGGVVTSHYAYSTAHGFDPKAYAVAGLSVNLMLDSRDSAINTYKGSYALASYRVNNKFLGSAKSSSQLWLEYRNYFDFGEKHTDILGLWAYGNFTVSGEVPYMALPSTSYDQFGKSGRGYVQGRFRGENMLYVEGEYRKHLMNWSVFGKDIPIGGVAFLNMQTLSSKGNDITLGEYIEPGYGVGLRFMLGKKTRTNLGIDFAWGNYQSGGVFMRLNETF
jgi:hypothetical protein